MALQGVHEDGYIQCCTSLASTLFSIEFEEFEGRVRLQGIVDWQVSLRAVGSAGSRLSERIARPRPAFH